ncbi:hypothetical protein LXL04_019880 [Taraxacum kok-saghyz]
MVQQELYSPENNPERERERERDSRDLLRTHIFPRTWELTNLFEKRKAVFSENFFATGLVFERFLAPRSRFFEKVNNDYIPTFQQEDDESSDNYNKTDNVSGSVSSSSIGSNYSSTTSRYVAENSNNTDVLHDVKPDVPDEFKPNNLMRFRSVDDAIDMYRTYAEKVGFDVRLNTERKSGERVIHKYLVCHRNGKPPNKSVEIKKKRNTHYRSTGCKAKNVIKHIDGSTDYRFDKFQLITCDFVLLSSSYLNLHVDYFQRHKSNISENASINHIVINQISVRMLQLITCDFVLLSASYLYLHADYFQHHKSNVSLNASINHIVINQISVRMLQLITCDFVLLSASYLNLHAYYFQPHKSNISENVSINHM